MSASPGYKRVTYTESVVALLTPNGWVDVAWLRSQADAESMAAEAGQDMARIRPGRTITETVPDFTPDAE